ncbi:MAG: hypothetical protein U1D55_00315 [Phycisphaerae bacterium]
MQRANVRLRDALSSSEQKTQLAALAQQLFPGGWSTTGAPYEARGHGSLIIQGWRDGWITPQAFSAKGAHRLCDCRSIHVEIEIPKALAPNISGRLHLHFESNPYLSVRELQKMASAPDLAEFNFRKEQFREAFAAHAESLLRSGWQMKHNERTVIQIATLSLPLSTISTVAETARFLTPHLAALGSAVDAAIRDCRW